jgi:hypothetical protein
MTEANEPGLGRPPFEISDGPLTYDIPAAGEMVGLGRNASYAAARRGEIPTIAFGRKKKVPGALWRKKLRGETA